MIPLRDVIPSRTTPYITVIIILINAVAWLFEIGLPRDVLSLFLQIYGVVPADLRAPTLITSMFLHGSWSHVLGNMWFLWIFGDNVEDRFGHGRFIVFYLICVCISAISQAWLDPTSQVPMVGASGAIAGVMGAYLVLYPHSRVLMLFPFPVLLYELPAVAFLGLSFFLQFPNGINQLPVFEKNAISGGVAFWAHVMGFVAGVILVVFMKRPERTRVDWWDTVESRDR